MFSVNSLLTFKYFDQKVFFIFSNVLNVYFFPLSHCYDLFVLSNNLSLFNIFNIIHLFLFILFFVYFALTWVLIVLEDLYCYVFQTQLFIAIKVKIIKESMRGVMVIVEVCHPVRCEFMKWQAWVVCNT